MQNRTFQQVDALFVARNGDEYYETLRREIEKMRVLLEEEVLRRRFSQEAYDRVANHYYQLADGLLQSNGVLHPVSSNSTKQVLNAYAAISSEVQDNLKASRRHAVIGAVIGGLVIGLAAAISVLSGGVGIPLGIILLNIGCGLISGAWIGSRYNSARTNYQHAKIGRAVTNEPTFSQAICCLFSSKPKPQPQQKAITAEPVSLPAVAPAALR